MWITNANNEDKAINLDKIGAIYCIDAEPYNKQITFEYASSGEDDACVVWFFESTNERDKCYRNIRGLIDAQEV